MQNVSPHPHPPHVGQPCSSKSWFLRIKKLCYQYGLPHTLKLLTDPPKKQEFKKLIKWKIQDFWQTKFREDAGKLESNYLQYFNPWFMLLSRPNQLWLSCGNTRYQLNKACLQAKYLFASCTPRHAPLVTSSMNLFFILYLRRLSKQTQRTFPILLQNITECEDYQRSRLYCSSVQQVIDAASTGIYEILFKATRILPSSAQAQAQAQLGGEIALFSQLWGTYTKTNTNTKTNTIHQHPTPGIVVFACP